MINTRLVIKKKLNEEEIGAGIYPVTNITTDGKYTTVYIKNPNDNKEEFGYIIETHDYLSLVKGTEVQDDRGLEIYEGDRVRVTNPTGVPMDGVVIYHNGAFKVDVGVYKITLGVAMKESIRIIGNKWYLHVFDYQDRAERIDEINVAFDAFVKDANKERKNDNVNRPSHYSDGKYECIDVMIDVYGADAVATFCKLNAFKYIWRADKKNGNEDINKAKWYLSQLSKLGGDK